MTSPKIQIAKKLSDFDRATSSIGRIMLKNNGGSNTKPQFFSRKSTYIYRLVMTSPKIQIAKKLSDFDRATSSIGRIMLRNNGGSNAKPQFFSRKSTYICRLVMTSPELQIAKKFPILTAQLLKSIRICLEIMVVTMRSRNFFSRKSTYICRLVMTSPKIQIAKKLSDFDRATSSIGRIMLKNNGGSNTKPQFFSRKSTYIYRLVMTSPKIQIAKKLSDFDRATSSIGRIMLKNNGGSNTKPQFFSRKSTYIYRLVMTSPKI